MPRVWRERPNVRVNIVGHNPPRQLRDLITHHASGITLLGSVPDIRPYLQQAGVAVAPMPYGAGIQNKVLEAMACATPVVATPQAVSAIQAIDGEHLLLGAPPAVFARQVLRLLEDANLRARVGAAGRRYAETHHDWNTIAKQLEEIYDHAVKQSRFTK
jgi:glycosyltransferase involved in cell wall biosynthesis